MNATGNKSITARFKGETPYIFAKGRFYSLSSKVENEWIIVTDEMTGANACYKNISDFLENWEIIGG